MSDWPTPLGGGHRSMITTVSPECLGVESARTNAFPSAGTAGITTVIYAPIRIYSTVTVLALGWFNGATLGANIDVGVYEGTTRLVSTGTTAQNTISIYQEVAVTPTTLLPGNYYLATTNTGTGNFQRLSVTGQVMRLLGFTQQVANPPLPATATPVLAAFTTVPIVAMRIAT